MEKENKVKEIFFLAQHNFVLSQRDQGIWPGFSHVLSEYRVAGKSKAKKANKVVDFRVGSLICGISTLWPKNSCT